MAFPVELAGVGSKLLGGLFGGLSKKKKEEAERKAAIGQAELKNQMAEDRRLGALGAGASILDQLAGKGFTNVSPEAMAALKQRRTYDFSKGVPEAGAGMGSGLLEGLFNTAGDYAFQYGANEQDGMSPGQAGVPMQKTPDVPDLRSRVGEFATGIDYRLRDPQFGG